MKKYISLLFVVFVSFLSTAQVVSIDTTNTAAELNQKIIIQEQNFNNKLLEIKSKQDANFTILKEDYDKILNQLLLDIKTLTSALDSLKLSDIEFKSNTLELNSQIVSLENQLNDKFEGLKSETNQLEVVANTLTKDLSLAKDNVEEISESSSKNSIGLESVNQEINQKQLFGLIFLVVFLIIMLVIYFLLNNNSKKLAAKQKEILEKQILDSQKITDWLVKQSSDSFEKNKSGEIDHSFAKRVADEIVRITTNLLRMDNSIKGYKQLSASVRKLEHSLNANNYELESLLNKPYDNGMNLQANFVIDESLKEGESIITRIVKPQINYKGKLIQAAQVEVSQGE